MSEDYAIMWSSSLTGKTGVGEARFDKDEAKRLCEELNKEYPDIKHWTVAEA